MNKSITLSFSVGGLIYDAVTHTGIE